MSSAHITDMALPDAVVEAACHAFRKAQEGTATVRQSIDAAIRAALQALVDTGRAEIRSLSVLPDWENNGQMANCLIIRLDADERERALQEKRK